MSEPPDSAKSPADMIPLVYKQLRAMAASFLRGERAGHTLQPTALVHEAYVALAGSSPSDWHGKTHFMAVAARQMHRVLVDYARKRNADKRGGGWAHVQLDERIAINGGDPIDILTLHDALEDLTAHNARQSLVVEYRVFGGLSEKEIAVLLDVSERTVRNDWTLGRARLVQTLNRH